METKEKIFLGSIGIIYRKNSGQLEFLIVENSKTKNITFVAGAKEENDKTPIDTLKREIKEELGSQIEEIKFEPTEVKHEFIFGPNKKERAGYSGSYQVFLIDATNIKNPISHTEELKNIKWLTKNEVINSLTFPDLKDVFIKATNNLS